MAIDKNTVGALPVTKSDLDRNPKLTVGEMHNDRIRIENRMYKVHNPRALGDPASGSAAGRIVLSWDSQFASLRNRRTFWLMAGVGTLMLLWGVMMAVSEGGVFQYVAIAIAAIGAFLLVYDAAKYFSKTRPIIEDMSTLEFEPFVDEHMPEFGRLLDEEGVNWRESQREESLDEGEKPRRGHREGAKKVSKSRRNPNTRAGSHGSHGSHRIDANRRQGK